MRSIEASRQCHRYRVEARRRGQEVDEVATAIDQNHVVRMVLKHLRPTSPFWIRLLSSRSVTPVEEWRVTEEGEYMVERSLGASGTSWRLAKGYR